MLTRLTTAVAAALALPALAAGAPVAASYDPVAGLRVEGTPAGETVIVTLDGTPQSPVLRVTGVPDGAAPGTGCAAKDREAVCAVPAGGSQAVSISLGDGDDRLEVVGLDATADLGPGDDLLLESGMNRMTADLGPGDDEAGLGDVGGSLSGGDGDDILGGGLGSDVLAGGPGADSLYGTPGEDDLDGGPGPDTADYRRLMTPSGPIPSLFADLGAGDGVKRVGRARTAAAGTDDLSGIEGVAGTPLADLIVGGPGAERLDGWSGDDEVRSREGVPDVIACGAGNDVLDIDLKDRVSDSPVCEQSARGAVGELPNVRLVSARVAGGGRTVRVRLSCPAGSRPLGCAGSLRAARGGPTGPSARYRLAPGAAAVVTAALPKATGPITILSVERGRKGARTTIRAFGAGSGGLAGPEAAKREMAISEIGALEPPIGTLVDESRFDVAGCVAPGQYVTSIRIHPQMRLDLGPPPRTLKDGFRGLEVLCAPMLEGGNLGITQVGPDSVGVFFGGDGPFGAGAATLSAGCEFSNLGVLEVHVATGVTAEVAERSDPPYLRNVGLECSFADDLDPILADVEPYPAFLDETALRPDGRLTCPAGSALTGIYVGFDRGQYSSASAFCDPYPLVAPPPRDLRPGQGETIAFTTGAVFSWRGSGAVARICLTSRLPVRCVRTFNRSVPLGEFLTAADVGTQITWTVQQCNAAQEGSAPDRACGATSRVPDLGLPSTFGARLAPRPPVAVSAGRPRSPLASSRALTLSASFRGGVFADRHRLRILAGAAVVGESAVAEDQANWGAQRTGALSATIPSGRQVVKLDAAACADDPSAPGVRPETCGERVVLATFLVDTANRVCPVTATIPKACPLP